MTLYMASPQFDLLLFFFLPSFTITVWLSIDHNDNKNLIMIITIKLYSLFPPLTFLWKHCDRNVLMAINIKSAQYTFRVNDNIFHCIKQYMSSFCCREFPLFL